MTRAVAPCAALLIGCYGPHPAPEPDRRVRHVEAINTGRAHQAGPDLPFSTGCGPGCGTQARRMVRAGGRCAAPVDSLPGVVADPGLRRRLALHLPRHPAA